jgi:hypothetical protein
MHLSNLQRSQIPAFWLEEQYPDSFNQEPLPHRHFNHALTHAMKALGKLAAYSDALDHRQMDPVTHGENKELIEANQLHEDRGKWLADLVICAGRMAQQANIDLDAATEDRLIELGRRWGAEMPSTRPTVEELCRLLEAESDRKATALLPNGEVTVQR